MSWLIPYLLTLTWVFPAVLWAEEAIDRAVVRHERGLELFESGAYRQAAAEFEAAEGLAHSRANLMNLARCYQELGEPARALDYLAQYLTEPDLPPESRARAESVREELRSAMAAGAAGEPAPDPAPAESPAGGGTPTTGGEGGPSLVGPWVTLGSGLALLLVGGVLDVVVYARLGGEEQSFTSLEEREELGSGSMALAIAGDVLVGVGAAAAVAGLVWLLVARSRGTSGASGSGPLSIAIAPQGVVAGLLF